MKDNKELEKLLDAIKEELDEGTEEAEPAVPMLSIKFSCEEDIPMSIEHCNGNTIINFWGAPEDWDGTLAKRLWINPCIAIEEDE